MDNDQDEQLSEQSVLGKRSNAEMVVCEKEDVTTEDQSENQNIKKKQKLDIVFSNTDNFDKSIEYIAGIDEAGRGPVLGPMVYSIAFFPFEQNEKLLRKIGFNDSKKLSEAQRDKLFEKIFQHNVGFILDSISAETLSTEMLRIDGRNLNRISHDSAIGLIGKVLELGFKLRSVFVDTVGKPEKYQDLLISTFPSIPNITVSKKADSLFPIVGAASICAKVIRDRVLSDWQYKEVLSSSSYTFGSGYPGDQVTKDWLQDSLQPVFGFPSLVRYSWATTTNILSKDACDVYWSFEDNQALEELNAHERMSEAKKKTLLEASKRARLHKEAVKKTRFNYFANNGIGRSNNL